jgi:hypothetical protein
VLLVGFEPTISVYERAKTVYTLDRATSVMGHESVWGSGYINSRFLDIGARGKWSVHPSCRFTPAETAIGIHWTGGWVGPRTVWTRGEEKILIFTGIRTPNFPSSSP